MTSITFKHTSHRTSRGIDVAKWVCIRCCKEYKTRKNLYVHLVSSHNLGTYQASTDADAGAMYKSPVSYSIDEVIRREQEAA